MNIPEHEAAEFAPQQHAGGPAVEPLDELTHPTHKGDHDPAHHNDPEAVRKEVRRYLAVFVALAGLTVITVAISYLHLPHMWAIVVALVVAAIKGSLVAAVFMHLISERKLIYAVLVLTVFFFGMLLWGPWHHRHNAVDAYPGYDVNASKGQAAQTSEQPGSGAEHQHH